MGTSSAETFFEHASVSSSAEHRILSPTAASPALVSGEGVIEIQVRLLLPLTPPPGVQQPKANKGWRVTLILPDAYTLDGRRVACRYEHKVMRLRPVEHDVYRLTVEVMPWLVAGRYDVQVTGPGFFSMRPAALIIGEASSNPGTRVLSVAAIGSNVLEISNSASSLDTVKIRLNDDFPGIAVRSPEGEAVPPTDAAFASYSEKHGPRGTLLSYPVALPSPPRPVRWRWIRANPRTCGGRIEWREDDEAADTMDWRDLTYLPASSVEKVIWRFGDGRWGVGERIRHRWLLSNEATVTATDFDAQGHRCATTVKKNLNTLRQGIGCTCEAPSAHGGKSPLWGLFFLLNRAVEE